MQTISTNIGNDKDIKSNSVVKTLSDYIDPYCLLSRYSLLFIVFTVVEFFVLEILLQIFGEQVCNDKYVRESWTRDVNMFVAGAFALDAVLHIFRSLTGITFSERNLRSTFYTAFVVSSIAAYSSTSTLLFPKQMCVDGFG